MSLLNGRSEVAVNNVWRLMMRVTIIALTIYALYHLRAIIDTLLIGAIFGYMFDPIIHWMQHRPLFFRLHGFLLHRKGMNKQKQKHILRLLATLYVFIAALIFLWQGGKLVAQPFAEQYRNFAANQERYISEYDKIVPESMRSEKIREFLSDKENQKKLQETSLQAAGRVAATLKYVVEVVLLPVLAFYFILDGDKLKREFIALAPRKYFNETVRMVREFNLIMRAYVLGQFILCALAGIIVWLGLAALKVEYASIMGLIAGLTRAIPIIGPIIGGIPIIGFTFISGGESGMQKALAVLAFFSIMHFAESKFIMPMLIGERMELHPVIIIVVLLIGGEFGNLLLGGILGALLGMFFAPPVAAIIRVMVRRYRLKIRAPFGAEVAHEG